MSDSTTVKIDSHASDLEYATWRKNPSGKIARRVSVDKDTPVPVKVGNSVSADAFGRFRVSNPKVLFEALHTFSDKPFLFSNKIAGGGSVVYDAVKKNIQLKVGTASGDEAIRQSKSHFQYTPGSSLQTLFTMRLEPGKTNLRQRLGFFDDLDGWFFEQVDNVMGVVMRSNITGTPVPIRVTQPNWNIDVMDGTGSTNNPSGLLIDWTKQQILVIDFQYLGAGRSRFCVDIGGQLYPMHEFNFANLTSEMFNAQPSKPVRYEITNTGITASPSQLNWHCSSVIVEGANKPPTSSRVAFGLDGVSISSSVFEPILSIRLKAGFEKATLLPKAAGVITSTQSDVVWKLTLGHTLTGAVWNSISPNSISEMDVVATAMSGGEEIQGGFSDKSNVAGGVSGEILNQIGSDIDGVSDILTLSAKTISGASTVRGLINFEELY